MVTGVVIKCNTSDSFARFTSTRCRLFYAQDDRCTLALKVKQVGKGDNDKANTQGIIMYSNRFNQIDLSIRTFSLNLVNHSPMHSKAIPATSYHHSSPPHPSKDPNSTLSTSHIRAPGLYYKDTPASLSSVDGQTEQLLPQALALSHCYPSPFGNSLQYSLLV